VIGKFDDLLQELNDKVKSTGVCFTRPSAIDELQLEGQATGFPCYCTKGCLKPSVGGKYECDSCHRVVELPDGDSFGNQSNL